MAATSGIAHGGKRNNSGRKRKYERSTNAQKLWNSQHKRIYLSLSIFGVWNAAKTEAGYAYLTTVNSQHICSHWNTVEGAVYSILFISVYFCWAIVFTYDYYLI
jgi:hypothetical protein